MAADVSCRGLAGTPRVIETGSGRGTEIRLEPDPDIFNDTRIDPTRLGEMLEEACFLYPGIRISLNKQLFHAPGGLADLARRLLETSTVNDRWGDRPAFSMQESFDDMMIHAAAVGYAENSTHCCSWVNYQKTPAGGTHQTAFTHALRTAGWKPQILLIHTIMRDARFAGPTRQMLDMPGLQHTIAERIQPLLSDYCRQKSLRAD